MRLKGGLRLEEIEIWKDVTTYFKMDGSCFNFEQGKYKVSNFGRVKSFQRCKNGKLLKEHLTTDANGYKQVQMYLYDKNSDRKITVLSRLVAQYFCYNDDPINKKFVNHKDESPSFYSDLKINNNSNNLEWCTREYNASYGTVIQRIKEKQRSSEIHKRQSDMFSKTVGQFSKETGELIKIWKSTKEIERTLGYDNGCISACCRHYKNQYTMYGYVWRYIHEDK